MHAPHRAAQEPQQQVDVVTAVAEELSPHNIAALIAQWPGGYWVCCSVQIETWNTSP